MLHRIISAKELEAEAWRLAALNECNAAGQKIPAYDIGKKK